MSELEARQKTEQVLKMSESLDKIPQDRRAYVVAHLEGICEGMRLEAELKKAKETA